MSLLASSSSTIIPAFRYSDAPAAIKWLCEAFDFAEHLVVPDGEGGVAHAQLKLGNAMIMLGSARDDAFGKLVGPQGEGPIEDLAGQSIYVVVPDADEHYARAVAAGAKIEADITDQDHGGRAYTCRDLEGHVWTFGTYDPWAET